MNLEITETDILISTLIFACLASLLAIPLVLFFRNPLFAQARWPITIASGVLWGLFAVAMVFGFWDLYYRHIFNAWMRWVTPLDSLFYAAIALGMWWLAGKLPGSAVLWFVLLGGLEGVLEHLLGIYGMGILEKVPWLEGVGVLPVVVFSFFEYTFYWAIVAWLGYGITKVVS